jgi:putative phosphoesterase
VRLAVVSDVHGNLTALDAVAADLERQGVDAVVQGGDLALMGPRPAEVVDRIRELGWDGIAGNTDELLWRPEERGRQEQIAPKLRPVLELLFEEYAPFTRELLGEERIGWLRGLPLELERDGLVVVHASPGDLWRAPMPDADDDRLRATYGGLGAPVVAYGHIHRPFVRALGELTVANSGSVGMPWDGDPRASYLLVDGERVRVMRVEYDVEAEARLLARSGHPDVERLIEMRRTGSFVRPGR